MTPGRSTFGVARATEIARSELAHSIIYSPDAPRNAPAKTRWQAATEASTAAPPSQVQQVPKPGAVPLSATRTPSAVPSAPVAPKAPVKPAPQGRRSSALTGPALPAKPVQPKGDRPKNAEASKPKQTQNNCHARPTSTKGNGSGRDFTGRWCK